MRDAFTVAKTITTQPASMSPRGDRNVDFGELGKVCVGELGKVCESLLNGGCSIATVASTSPPTLIAFNDTRNKAAP